MHIQEIWRYPVKSMRGERVREARLSKNGISGDRNIIVVSQPEDRIVTARTHPRLLGLQASVSPEGVPLINGYPWDSRKALTLTQEAAGEPVRLVDVGEREE